jgi:hypothetical protein
MKNEVLCCVVLWRDDLRNETKLTTKPKQAEDENQSY